MKPAVDNTSNAQKSIEAQLAWAPYFPLGAIFARLGEAEDRLEREIQAPEIKNEIPLC